MSTYTKETIDAQTGETTKIEKQFWTKTENKKFVKTFLEDLHLIEKLPSGAYWITFALLPKMDYDNLVTINSSLKREIAERLKISFSYVNQSITMLLQNNILIRKDRGRYWLNPKIFAKVNDDRANGIQLLVDYSDGEKTIKTNITSNGEKISE